jgi:hypothetical protein
MLAAFASLLAAARAEEASFPYFVPIQIAQPTDDHTSLRVTAEVEKLRTVTTPIALIAVVGPYHSGKSFLLNALTEGTGIFSVGKKTSPETMGVWICRTDIKAQDNSEVWLMDSEGFFGPGVSEDYDAKVFTLATLLGSMLVYNTIKIIDQQAVNLLEMLTRRAKLFRVRSKASADATVPGFLTTDFFPSLVWVVEDFVQDLGGQSAEDWLMAYNSNSSDGENYFKKVFPSVSVHTLFLPAVKQEALQDLSQIPYGTLTPEFRSEVGQLRQYLLKNARAKPFEGHGMTGSEIATALHFVARGLTDGFFPDLPSLWQSWQLQVAALSVEDAARWFRDVADALDKMDVMPVAKFAEIALQRRKEALAFYRSLIADFDVDPKDESLAALLCDRQETSVAIYHEKVRAHVSLRIATLKKEMQATLDVPMPTDPRVLNARTEKERDSFTRTLEQEISLLDGKVDKRVEYPFERWPAAGLPAFVEAPSSTLRADLEAMRNAAALENERLVLQEFKSAVQTALGQAKIELQERASKLLGDKMLEELSSGLESSGTKVYDDHFNGVQWYFEMEHYKPHRAVLLEEVRQSMKRFSAKNAAAIKDFLAAKVRALLDTYEEAKWHLERRALPCETEVLRAAHNTKASEVLRSLDNASDTILDTAAFKESRKELDKNMEERFKRLEAKNVELWKVHSDEATACALKLIEEGKKSCMFGFLCLEQLVPWYHRRASWQRLDQCFESTRHPVTDVSSSGRNEMPVSMRKDVFEIWYTQDLAQDHNAVYWNLWWSFVSVVVLGSSGYYVISTQSTTYGITS